MVPTIRELAGTLAAFLEVSTTAAVVKGTSFMEIHFTKSDPIQAVVWELVSGFAVRRYSYASSLPVVAGYG